MNINANWPYNEFKKIYKSPSKLEQLEKLKQEIAKLDLGFNKAGQNFVFNEGNINAEIMLIGEAPGEEEDLQKLPFVGRSGKLLRYLLKEADLTNFYITNIVPWRPPENRTPTLEEIKIMSPFIKRHIQIIKPKIIIPVGATCLKALEMQESISQIQGTLIETKLGKIFPIFHPSYALRTPSKKKDIWLSLLKLKQVLIT